MGADFLLTFLTIDPAREVDLAAGRAAVQELALKPLGEWPEDYLDSAGIDLTDEAEREEMVRGEHVRLLLQDLEVIEAALAGRRRDTWVTEIGGKRVLLSGGMSWGDAPTDAFAALDRLSLAEVTRAMGFDW